MIEIFSFWTKHIEIIEKVADNIIPKSINKYWVAHLGSPWSDIGGSWHRISWEKAGGSKDVPSGAKSELDGKRFLQLAVEECLMIVKDGNPLLKMSYQ